MCTLVLNYNLQINFLLVFIGGGIGCVLRLGIGLLIQKTKNNFTLGYIHI